MAPNNGKQREKPNQSTDKPATKGDEHTKAKAEHKGNRRNQQGKNPREPKTKKRKGGNNTQQTKYDNQNTHTEQPTVAK
jgi:hypothetical protein